MRLEAVVGDSPEPHFGALLRRMRMRAGLTQEMLAGLSGLSVRGISDLERGQRSLPRLETIRMLADAMNLDESERSELTLSSRPHLRQSPGEPSAIGTSFSKWRHKLPHSLTSLIGRTREMSEITSLILHSGARLLTLTGPGGIGKTRLVLQLAEELVDEFSSGVHFVPLVPLNSADLVMPAIAEALDVREADGMSVQATLLHRLRDAQVLLLLDNFEHVLDAATQVQELLANCPGVKVVATSRAPLHLRMEHIYDVSPLDLLDSNATGTLADLDRYDALALFVDRARLADVHFEPDSEDVLRIAFICERLDGLPLAIELAAARSRVLSLQELQAALTNTLPMLTSGARDLPQRHQTLQNTVDWSYNLLSEAEQQLFRRLAVFAGGWTLDAAEAVTHVPRLDGSQSARIMDDIGSLVDQSLVRRTGAKNSGSRFGMLQIIREFGLAQLAAFNEVDPVRQRHAIYFLEFMERLRFDQPTANEPSRLGLVDMEYDNLRAAMRWLIDRQDAARALTLCTTLYRFWIMRCFLSEARGWIQEALAIPDPTPGTERATALYTGCLFACHLDDLAEAERLINECLALSRALADDACIATALHGLGLVAQLQEDHPRASEVYTECIVVERELVHSMLPVTLGNLAQVEFHLGNAEYAIELFDECVRMDRASEDILHAGAHMTDLGLVLTECRDMDRAYVTFKDALAIHRSVGNARMVIITIEGLAAVNLLCGNPERASCLYGAAEALREHFDYPRKELDRWSYADYLNRARQESGDAAFTSVWTSGRGMSMDDAIALALLPPDSSLLPEV